MVQLPTTIYAYLVDPVTINLSASQLVSIGESRMIEQYLDILLVYIIRLYFNDRCIRATETVREIFIVGNRWMTRGIRNRHNTRLARKNTDTYIRRRKAAAAFDLELRYWRTPRVMHRTRSISSSKSSWIMTPEFACMCRRALLKRQTVDKKDQREFHIISR